MLKLYRITFEWARTGGSLQAVIASGPNKKEAVRRARAFVASQYPEAVRLDEAEAICSTPDDVLDWS